HRNSKSKKVREGIQEEPAQILQGGRAREEEAGVPHASPEEEDYRDDHHADEEGGRLFSEQISEKDPPHGRGVYRMPRAL
ncbi:MAG TPA: hypothetical protein VMS77_03280, partial [Conexivisphaerales archaeon]|nr:hypothetical protein [Conexivisphaerales archaeon]